MKVKDFTYFSFTASRLLLYSVFILPFVVMTAYYFPFIVPRNIIFRIVIVLAVGLFVALIVTKKIRFSFPRNKIFLAYCFLVTVLTLSSVFNGDFAHSFWSTYERMEGLVTYYHLIAFLLLLLFFFRTDADWTKLIRFTLFISFLIAAVAWWQNAGIRFLVESAGGERVSSMLGNATYLATYALFHIFFALYMIFKRTHNLRFEGWLFIGLTVLMLATEYWVGAIQTIFENGIIAVLFFTPIALILLNLYHPSAKVKAYAADLYFILLMVGNFFALFNTQTRGALVGLLIGVFAMLVVTPFLTPGAVRLRKFTTIGVIAFVILVGSVFYFKDSDFVRKNATLRRLSTISADDTTSRARILTWETVWKGFKEKPILGWGEENFFEVFNKYFPSEIYRHNNSRIWYDRPHNIFLQPLIQGGIVGFVLYLSIFAFIFSSLWTYKKKSGDVAPPIVLGGLTLAYMVQNAFVFDSINSYIIFMLLLGYIIYLSDEQLRSAVASSVTVDQRGESNTLPVLVVLLFIGIAYVFNIPHLMRNREYVRALDSFSKAVAGGNEDVILKEAEHIQEIMGRLYLGKFELRHTWSEQVSDIVRNRRLPNETALKIGKIAGDELIKSIDEQPSNVRHIAFLVQLYMDMGALDPYYAVENIKYAEKAVALSPTRPHFYYTLGRSNIVRQSYGEAIENFEHALELAPKVYDAHVNYLVGFALTNNIEDAYNHVSVIEKNMGRALTSEEWIGIAEVFHYVRATDKALAILEGELKENPESIPLLQRIAIYYAALGEKEKALAHMSRVVDIDPSFKADFEQFRDHIDELKRTP